MSEVKMRYTERGFAIGEFVERNGQECSIQQSSVATEDCIWLGVDEPTVQVFRPGQGGWQKVPLPADVQIGGRMHLTRATVKALLPLLREFVKTGSLPVPVEAKSA